MPTLPTVSVVIPSYNAEAFVDRAVASALAQTASPLEVICIDDGSADGTLGVLRRAEADHPGRVTVLAGPNRGACAARNRGLAAASGAYVQFLDADDTLAPEKIERQLRVAETASADLVVGPYERRGFWGKSDEAFPDVEDPWVSLFTVRLGITSANLYRRAAVEAVGGWDEGLASAQDADLALRLLQHGASVASSPDVDTLVTRHEGSVWNRDFGASLARALGVHLRAADHLRRAGALTPARSEAFLTDAVDRLRALARIDLVRALELHERVLEFTEAGLSFGSRSYDWAYRVAGLRGASFVERVYRRLRAGA